MKQNYFLFKTTAEACYFTVQRVIVFFFIDPENIQPLVYKWQLCLPLLLVWTTISLHIQSIHDACQFVNSVKILLFFHAFLAYCKR